MLVGPSPNLQAALPGFLEEYLPFQVSNDRHVSLRKGCASSNLSILWRGRTWIMAVQRVVLTLRRLPSRQRHFTNEKGLTDGCTRKKRVSICLNLDGPTVHHWLRCSHWADH